MILLQHKRASLLHVDELTKTSWSLAHMVNSEDETIADKILYYFFLASWSHLQ